MAPTRLVLSLLALQTLPAYGALPKVDFERMGKVGVAGSFAGIDLYNDNQSTQQQTTFDSTTSTLFLRAQDGSLTPIGSTNGGGRVVTGCSMRNVFYVGGTFTTLGGTNSANIASYSSSTNKIAQLADGGLDGPVSALHCDEKNGVLWVGGSFRAPTTGNTAGFAGSVATYNPSSNTWSAPPFAGLPGTVNAIVPTTSNSALLFGGSFVTSYGNSTINATAVTNPNVITSSGSTPFSLSLVPFPLANAEIDASPSSTLPRLGDITNILCPAGPDGAGNAWFAQDGFKAVLTIRTFKQLSASGLRLGNTFFDGRSTTTFKVTSIPDNKVLTLTYNKPGTNETEQCSDPCSLSTDPSVHHQDFLFDSPTITGLEVVLTSWIGDGPGLHLLQLLSDGAFASATDAQNDASCYAPEASSIQTTGSWTQQEVRTQIPATTQNVLVVNVAAGSTSSVTWNVYTSASGQYDVYIWVPGCDFMQDCDARTTVDVTITPGGPLSPVTKTISQQVNSDTRILVYTGPIIPPTSDFLVSVKMQLASNPQGTGINGQYELVADRVEFELKSTNLDGSSGNSSLLGPGQRGFGLFEWPLENSFGSINATGALPNNTLSTLNAASQQLFTQLNSTASSTVQAIAPSSDTLFLAGKFTLTNKATNIVGFKSNALVALAQNGLNGAVSSLVLYGDSLFVGGNFEATADNSTPLRYIAQYSISGNTWSPLGGGVDGPVTSLNQENGRLSVAGNFTHVLFSGSSTPGLSTAGFASWDIKSKTWVNSGGLFVGAMTFVGNATANGEGEYIAGNVKTYRKYGTDGMVSLNTDKNGQAVITPLGARLDVVAGTSTTNANARKRWSDIFKRQARNDTLPSAAPSPAPAVLAGAFWTNTTNSREVLILGGNFSIPSSDGDVALAIYDPDSKTIKGLEGEHVQGVVRALLVVGNKLFIGGEFTVKGVSGSGFAVYDLQSQVWISAIPGFQASSGPVVVRSITRMSSQPTTVVVAGTFSSAGSTQCQGICALNSVDQANPSWSALGTDVQGEVSTVTYAGDKGDILLAAGALVIANKEAQVAMYSITNQTWTTVGTLPGPVTALSANDFNQTSLFAAGKTSGNGTPFLSHWDGAQWTTLDVSLGSVSNVTQLEFVPLSEEHDVQGIVQTNRMLWLSGSFSGITGSFSSALYDGRNLHPYLLTSTASGDPGVVSSFFHSYSTFSFDIRRYLARGVIILISIALGAGVVFLMCLVGLLWALFRRRDERHYGQDTGTDEKDYDDDMDSLQHPSSRLEHINAAIRNTIFMPKDSEISSNAEVAGYKVEESTVEPSDQIHAQRSDSISHEGTLAAGAGAALVSGSQSPVTTVDGDDVNQPAQARYSFEGNGEGELPLKTGEDVIVLNDQDPMWWYVRNKTTLKEGIVPASYLV